MLSNALNPCKPDNWSEEHICDLPCLSGRKSSSTAAVRLMPKLVLDMHSRVIQGCTTLVYRFACTMAAMHAWLVCGKSDH